MRNSRYKQNNRVIGTIEQNLGGEISCPSNLNQQESTEITPCQGIGNTQGTGDTKNLMSR